MTSGCQLTSPTNSNASNNNNNIPAKAKHNSTRRKTKSSSDTSSQLRSQQPRVEPRYEKAHLYPKVSSKEFKKRQEKRSAIVFMPKNFLSLKKTKQKYKHLLL